MSWYSIRWNEWRQVVAEKMEGPSPITIAAYERLIEKYKSDPSKAEEVRHYREELNRMRSNRW